MIVAMPAKTMSLSEPRQNRRGQWVVQWYTGRVVNGKPERKTRSFGRVTRAKSLMLWREFMLVWHPGYLGEDAADGMTLAQLADAYLFHADDYYRDADGNPTAEPDKVRYAMVQLRDLYGDQPVDQLEPKHLLAWQRAMARSKLARTTCNMRLNIVKRMLGWGVLEGHLSAAVKGRLMEVPSIPKGRGIADEPDEITGVSWSIVERTLAKCPPTLAAMIRVQWWTGMRPGEVCGMTTGEIDTTCTPWLYKPARHKNAYRGHRRTVCLGPEARKSLSPMLKTELSAPLFSPAQAHRERMDAKVERYDPGYGADYRQWASYKAKSRQGRSNSAPSYTTPTYRQAIAYACDAAGVPRWSPNQLRHEALSRIEREHGRLASSAVAGHANLNTTSIYVDRDTELAARIMEACG